MDFLSIAIDEALLAEKKGDVPVGCVITRGDKIIAKGRNQKERQQNALAHAEIVAIKRACRKLRSWRLDDCEMWVTLEPCLMCIGAILSARIKTVHIGTTANVSNLQLFTQNNLNWKTAVNNLKNSQCHQILVDFFNDKR